MMIDIIFLNEGTVRVHCCVRLHEGKSVKTKSEYFLTRRGLTIAKPRTDKDIVLTLHL